MGALTNCGPSTAVQNDAAQAQSFSNLMQANYQQQFGAQSAILSSLNAALSPIVSAGPNQQGFSPAELSALNSKAISNGGAAYKNAAMALGGQMAGHASSSGLESGVDKQLRAGLASSAAGGVANAENNINLQNYETGRQNFFNATSGQRALAGLYDPSSYGKLSAETQQQAFNQNHTVEQENNQMSAGIIGGITSLATGAATFGLGGLANLGAGESFGEGAGDFFKGGFNALQG
jgi:hypothetical protein